MIESKTNSESSSKMRRDSHTNKAANGNKVKVRLNLILRGEVAGKLIELRTRGIIRSYTDGIYQSIQLFYAKIVEQDLSAARLRAMEKNCEEDNVDN